MKLRILALSVAAGIGLIVAGTVPVGAGGQRLTTKYPPNPSYVVLHNGNTSLGTNTSPCNKAGCPNGIRFTWTNTYAISYRSATQVFDRYPPVAVVLTDKNNIVEPNWGPIISPWSTGLEMDWNNSNGLITMKWPGSAGPNKTIAYLPKAKGVDLFFQGANNGLASAVWLKNGKAVGTVAGGNATDVFWYGHTPPVSSFVTAQHPTVARGAAATPPHVVLFGRRGSSHATKSAYAPSSADGVEFDWYLNNYQKGQPGRGCVSADGQQWTSPLMAYAYTTNGILNSRVNVLTCPTTDTVIPFNIVNFTWTAVGDSYVISHASAAFDNGSNVRSVPADLPQPPAGTNGMQLEFHLDNFNYSHWTNGGSSVGTLSKPDGTKVATLVG